MALFWHEKGYFHFGVLGESVLQSSRYSLRARRDLEFQFSFTLMDLPVDSKKYNIVQFAFIRNSKFNGLLLLSFCEVLLKFYMEIAKPIHMKSEKPKRYVG